jgi:hypothetical protein
MKNEIKSFEDLIVWKKAHNIVLDSREGMVSDSQCCQACLPVGRLTLIRKIFSPFFQRGVPSRMRDGEGFVIWYYEESLPYIKYSEYANRNVVRPTCDNQGRT